MNNGANAQRQATTARAKRAASQTTLETYTDLDAQAVTEVSSVLRRLLADVFTLYLKTKNFHWAHDRAALPGLPLSPEQS